jgi:septal ring factor EnvC (AmiA/AmiB activator)
MYRNRRTQNQMMFVLSAHNINQMYRRMRFMNEYATLQRAQGEAVKQKGEQVAAKRAQLNQARTQLNTLLAQSESEQQQLEQKKEQQQQLVASLQNEQHTVRRLIQQQQREEAELNTQIDRLIAEELERQRRAEEERRLAEQRRREQQQRQQQAAASNNNRGNNNRGSNNNRGNNRGNSNNRGNNGGSNAATPTAPSPPTADQQLTGSFASNKGRLPVPITGSFRVVRRYGNYTMSGVTLNSNGVHLQGQEGAKARCIFDGEVSKIYNLSGGYVVMVRHGRYISVYCNLSSVSVTAGQRVSTNQLLGAVGADNTLIFRLQNWETSLDPKLWIGQLR